MNVARFTMTAALVLAARTESRAQDSRAATSGAPPAGAAAQAAAPAAPKKLKLTDVFELQLATEPRVSPDGTRVVFVRHFSDVMTDQRCSNLWSVGVDGSDLRPLTSGNYHDEAPRWAPDGRSLYFLSDRDGAPQIYRRYFDTGEIAKLTNLTSGPDSLAPSPDGRWLAFTMLVPSTGRQIASMPAPPEGAKWADPAVVIDKSVYRFDGAGYLKAGFTHVFVVPVTGGTPRQITSGDFHHGAGEFSGGEPVWTPDSKYLLLAANRRADFQFEPLDSEIWEFAVADGKFRALTDRRGPDQSPAISPDGTQIAYVGFDDRYQGYQVTHLYVMNRDGKGARALTADFDRDVAAPEWTPDGRAICFISEERGVSGLYECTLDGKVTRLASNSGASLSAYSGGDSFTIAKDGTYAFTSCRSDLPGDVAVGRLPSGGAAAGEPRVLTSLNASLFADRKLGRVEAIEFASKKDGRKIQGWVITPPDFDPDKKYPLILGIHGGPFAAYGERFDREKQIWAANGYVVLYTNPRGSTSYGEEFGNLIHHAYPGDDFFDLDAGGDAVIAKGCIDPDELFVTGGSGGGVLTCWCIGRTNRYRAAAAAYPVINWYSFSLTADAGAYFYKYWFPGLPWDFAEQYEKRSPISLVKNVKTPTMVITGEQDFRTPISESEQYFQALQFMKVESVLVRVPGESHGIANRPSHLMSKILHIQTWFDQHRKTAGDKSKANEATSSGAKTSKAGSE